MSYQDKAEVALVVDYPSIWMTQIQPQGRDYDPIAISLAFYSAARKLGISLDIVNVNGGAISMGHPLGATGAMLMTTVLDELERRDLQTAMITLCVGGGMGIATIIERV